jgi:hypothetical protein
LIRKSLQRFHKLSHLHGGCPARETTPSLCHLLRACN